MTDRLLERLLLILTVVGFVVPNVLLGIFIADEGFDVSGYFSLWTDSTPSTQLTLDLCIAALAFFVWAARRGAASRGSGAGGSCYPGHPARRPLLRAAAVPVDAGAGPPRWPSRPDYDVVVAGASLAGCAAARLFALAGARVALVERRPDPAAYKVACTHQIQSSAVPAIERLGLAPLLARAGAARSRPAGWTPHGGWLLTPDAPAGYGITRRRLDPILRELAVETPGVEPFLGQTVVGAGRRPRPGRRGRDRGHRSPPARADARR